jgi:predicted nucleic acid-binding protein
VYLDSSVVLAQVLAEDRRPPESLWAEHLISSRLLDYESRNRLKHLRIADTHGDVLREILSRVTKLELLEAVVAEPLDATPPTLRTLDAIHLASMRFLMDEGQTVRLATYDRRLAAAATDAGVALYPL